MSQEQPSSPQERGSPLIMFLVFMAVGGFIAFLIALSSGLLLYGMLGVFAFFALGAFHYLLWGRAMSEATENERKRDSRRERFQKLMADAEESPLRSADPDDDRIQPEPKKG